MTALKDIRILDLTRVLAGPFCTQLLADYGADVIKVEKPGNGDDTRAWGPPYLSDTNGNPLPESGYYLCANRNKQSLALDLSSPQDVDILKKIIPKCDILVENFKVGGLKKYGLDYESLIPLRPDLIYCSITGYGQHGPHAHKPGYDLIAQAFGGLMSITGEPDGEPMKIGSALGDIACGLYASTAILAALHHRSKTGEGQSIDIALNDCQIPLLANNATNYLLSGINPSRFGNAHPNIVPYQVFKTKDAHVVIAVGNDSQFQDFCRIIGDSQLAQNPKFITNSKRVLHREQLIPILKNILKSSSAHELIARLEQCNVPAGIINRIDQLFDSDQVKARDMIVSIPHALAKNQSVSLVGNPVKFQKTPVSYRLPPPSCGEHNHIILKDLLSS
jgi:crotonobetainyl-CoA:carnitine CoA-transferase CaiB-like acyl-CoA transferase